MSPCQGKCVQIQFTAIQGTRKQVTKFWIHFHHISVREDKLLLPLLLAHEHDVDLLRSH